MTTASADETRTLAAELARALPPDCTLALHGDLGVGKTTFVQGLAHGFGIAGPVTSPTFNIYTVHHAPGRLLVHLDAYRLDSASQAGALLIEDFLVPPWCLAVEWPEKIATFLPAGALHLDFGITSGDRHTLRLRSG
ncbi:MAG TPA: tRNA (adenosine(37)-N6)-threonylcarbamoyltransferase complex ATPase subunit type 1 TsaE [Opitutus sp.]|nr:tRNA (adenosine(37)-N6)-threonylcarbamoyltransferase complex ATPase subunit type 1 TsaE [Opitutus sp.]